MFVKDILSLYSCIDKKLFKDKEKLESICLNSYNGDKDIKAIFEYCFIECKNYLNFYGDRALDDIDENAVYYYCLLMAICTLDNFIKGNTYISVLNAYCITDEEERCADVMQGTKLVNSKEGEYSKGKFEKNQYFSEYEKVNIALANVLKYYPEYVNYNEKVRRHFGYQNIDFSTFLLMKCNRAPYSLTKMREKLGEIKENLLELEETYYEWCNESKVDVKKRRNQRGDKFHKLKNNLCSLVKKLYDINEEYNCFIDDYEEEELDKLACIAKGNLIFQGDILLYFWKRFGLSGKRENIEFGEDELKVLERTKIPIPSLRDSIIDSVMQKDEDYELYASINVYYKIEAFLTLITHLFLFKLLDIYNIKNSEKEITDVKNVLLEKIKIKKRYGEDIKRPKMSCFDHINYNNLDIWKGLQTILEEYNDCSEMELYNLGVFFVELFGNNSSWDGRRGEVDDWLYDKEYEEDFIILCDSFERFDFCKKEEHSKIITKNILGYRLDRCYKMFKTNAWQKYKADCNSFRNKVKQEEKDIINSIKSDVNDSAEHKIWPNYQKEKEELSRRLFDMEQQFKVKIIW